jgi:hypothetical protein
MSVKIYSQPFSPLGPNPTTKRDTEKQQPRKVIVFKVVRNKKGRLVLMKQQNG